MRRRTVSPEPEVDLNALCADARRRGLSYGQLVARTDIYEQEEIVKKYIADKEAAERAAKEKKKAEEKARKEREKGAWGGKRIPFDKARARQLYDQKKLDKEIALALGCSKATVCNWRNAEGLTPNKEQAHIDDEDVAKLYDQGWSDGRIAGKLGFSATAVRMWRNRRGLPAHFKPGGRARSC